MEETNDGQTAETGPEIDPVEPFRKKDLLDRVAARTSVKRSDAKSAAEATLAVLGEAIAAGEEINLPGFGKLKVNRTKDVPNGVVYICRIRQPLAPQVPLAERSDSG